MSRWTRLSATLAASTLLVLGVSAPSHAAGSVTFSVDAPYVQGSFVDGVLVETFDEGCVNPLPFGRATGDCNAYFPNNYSGASTTDSAPFQGGSATPLVAIGPGEVANFRLSAPARYVGFHWEAGNQFDRVRLYSDGVLIADFSFETLMAALEQTEFQSADGQTTYTVDDYFGNPVNGEQGHEPYAFVHIFATNGVTFDQVKISEDAESPGYFEFDNLSILFADDSTIDATTFDDVVELDSVTVRSNTDELAPTGANLSGGVLAAAFGLMAFALALRRRAARR